tara:strand:- start:4847 stop:5953 length:1107 start_codon:yes stop_codon:yes gene_type:complete
MFFMSKNGFDVVMASSDGNELKDVLTNEKCRHFVIPLTRKITPITDIIATYKLYKLFIKERPGIVHTHTPKAGIVGMLASYLAKVPNRLHTVAGLPLLESKGIKKIILNIVEKFTYFFATKVYVNSLGLKKIILDNNLIKHDKLKFIGNGSSNGIDTKYFDPNKYSDKEKNSLKKQLKINKNDFVFIFVGRVVGDKGINELIKAFNIFSINNDGIKLLIVGSFEENLDALNQKTKKIINSNKSIIHVGYQKDVRPFFSISNVLAFPSYREGFPNAVLQAGAMGIPSIVTNINGCNEIIIEDKNGMIIPVKNPEALLNAMEKIYLNPSYYHMLKNKCRIIIKNSFEQKYFWKELLKEYRSCKLEFNYEK